MPAQSHFIGVTKLHTQWVYGRTGGRAPPNKGSGDAPRDIQSRGGRHEDFVFDLEEADREGKRRDAKRRRSQSPDRREFTRDQRDRGHDRRRDDDRRDDYRREDRYRR